MPSVDDFKRAMVVIAHPDDAEWGCSASVAKWCRLGWDVIYVLCTDGSKGTDDRTITPEKLAEIRAKEQINAGKTLGLTNVEFLGNSDYIGHPDHFAAGEAALSAVFPSARDHLTFPELLQDEGLEPHKVREVWVMAFGDKANYWNPLTEQDVETSISALQDHISQISNPDEAGEWMKKRRANLGEKIGADYAESFLKFTLS